MIETDSDGDYDTGEDDSDDLDDDSDDEPGSLFDKREFDEEEDDGR